MATASRTTSRQRRDNPRPGPVTAKGLLVIAVLIGLGFLATRLYNGVPLRDYKTVYVSVPEVGNLLNHDFVRLDGVRVGQVIGRDVGDDGRPRIKLQLNPGVEVPADTSVAVRANGLLGARFVQLIRGDSDRQLADGATIEAGPGSYTFGLPETLDTFDKETRGSLGTMVRGLGDGFYGNGTRLNDAIRAGAAEARPFEELSREILSHTGAPARLISALDSAVSPADTNRRALAQLNGVAADAVRPFVTERAPTRATLDEAAQTLPLLPANLRATEQLLGGLRFVAREATQTLPAAPAGLDALARLLDRGRDPLAAADDLLEAAGPAVPGVLAITDASRPVLKPLRGTLNNATPILDAVSKYECDIRNFGAVMRSMTGFTQPGSGPAGPSQAFRLQLYLPVPSQVFGVRDDGRFNRRRGLVEPCQFLAKPYPQLTGGTR